MRHADPNLVMNLAAESHVDRSIDGSGAFIESNVNGTLTFFTQYAPIGSSCRRCDSGFSLSSHQHGRGVCLLRANRTFSETNPYDPRSPYSSIKAAIDHLVRAFHHTYGPPVVLTNFSNNYAPWQFLEANFGGSQGRGRWAYFSLW